MHRQKKPFKSDGCSMFPFFSELKGICKLHDKSYWKGGSSKARKSADILLHKRIKRKGYHKLAVLMYYAVRIFGHPYWPFPWRWDYGNKWPGRYKDGVKQNISD